MSENPSSDIEKLRNIMDENFRSMINNLKDELNHYNRHICSRFDDMENRLSKIESKLNLVGKHSELLPDISSILEGDGRDLAKLSLRVKKLEK